MTLTEFMELSPSERLNLAPTIAKYNIPSTAEFKSVIEQINRKTVSMNTLFAFTVALESVPK